MTSQIPAVVQNENLNLPIYRGKGVSGVKPGAPKSSKPVLQERRALRDLSNTNKPVVLGAAKASALKEKAGVKDKSASRGCGTAKNAPKSGILTDEEIERCREWAAEGVEHAPFTGNDSQKLQKDRQEEYVRKEVEEVISALQVWNAFEYGMPLKRVAEDTEDTTKLELLPEVIPAMTSLGKSSGDKQIEDILEPELDLFVDGLLEIKLREIYDDCM